MSAIRLHNLTLGYERRPAVHHLDGAFAEGRLHAVVGPNGSGKSTLLKGVAGALRPLSGRVELDGVRARDIAYLPQDNGISRTFPMTLEALVSLGLWNRRGLFGAITRKDRADIEAAMAAVGLTGFENRGVDEVSGGQLQRALFARVLVQDARVILLDEPFTALDARTTSDLLALIERWPREGRTVVMVLHDLDMVRRTCADTLLLAREAVAWDRTERALDPANLLRARRLSEAWAENAGVCHHDEQHDHHHGQEHDHDHDHDHGRAA
jgi:zinc/manganese transport system ATP-binding protein